MDTRLMFSSQTADWGSPPALQAALSDEFGLSYDPCPIGGAAGLEVPWFGGVFVNPPYGPAIPLWIDKALEELAEARAEVIVFLLPARTDTKWFHDQVLPNASEIRFIRGRLKFGGAETNAPFPSMVIVFGSRRARKRGGSL